MTTHTLTNTRAWRPAGMAWRHGSNRRVSASSLSPAVETTALPGGLWRCSTSWPAQRRAERGALAGLVAQLQGSADKLAMWDVSRPQPLGNIDTTGVTLGASAAQFASTLTLAGCYPRANLLKYPQELDNAVWTKSACSITANAITAPDGTSTADKLVEDSSTSGHYITQSARSNAVVGTYYTGSVYLRSAGRTWAYVGLFGTGYGAHSAYVDLTSGAFGTVASGIVQRSIQDAGSGWWRVSITVLGAAAAGGNIRIYTATGNNASSYAGDGSSGIYAWGAQIETGTAPTDYARQATLLGGDRLGVGGQLLMVTQAATATDAGAMTVSVIHRLRAAQSSGAAVTLLRPTALFIPDPAAEVMWPEDQGGLCGPVSIDWVEAP